MKQTTATHARGSITPPIFNPYTTPDPLLDSREAAKVIGLDNPHTLEIWRCIGKPNQPEYIRIGRKVRYRLSSLHAFLESNTVRTSAAGV